MDQPLIPSLEEKKKKKVNRKKKNKPLCSSDGRVIPSIAVRRAEGERGRYLVATQPIGAGSVIFCEPALAWTPFPHTSTSLCSFCGTSGDFSSSSCQECQSVAYCSPSCRQKDAALHSKACPFLLQVDGVAGRCDVDPTLLRATILLISSSQLTSEENQEREAGRVKGEYDLDRATWDEFLLLGFHSPTPEQPNLGLEPAWKEVVGKALAELYSLSGTKIVAKYVQIAQRFLENTHAMEDVEGENQLEGLGMFPRVSLINHSCAPSCCLSRLGDSISVRTLRDHSPGEELTITYSDLYLSTSERQRQLLESRFFLCQCPRCVSNEKDSLLQGVLCTRCSPQVKLPFLEVPLRSLPSNWLESLPTALLYPKDGQSVTHCSACGRPQTEKEKADLSEWIIQTREQVKRASYMWSSRQYSDAGGKALKILKESVNKIHPFHEVLFNLYPLLMNFSRFLKNEEGSIIWCRVIIAAMEQSGAFPAVYPEVSNYYYYLGELYTAAGANQATPTGPDSQTLTQNATSYAKQAQEAFRKAESIRIICQGPTHPSTLAARENHSQ